MAAAGYIKTELGRAGLTPHAIDVTARGVTLPTVWAEIPGAQCPNRVFVLTGHYDTVPGSPGTDDDASGVAAMLETARILAKAHLPATVVVAGLPFEEDGQPYAGSAALASELLDNQQRHVVGMVSAEMLGYADSQPDEDGKVGDYLNVLGYPGAEQLVQVFDRANTAWAGGAKVQAATIPETESFISRSDHQAFHARGVPAAFATDGANFRTPYYHTPQDTTDNIVKPFLAGAARTLVAGTIGMAGRTTVCAG
jgi:Zn-dependent M28 family amino/carboxypeptidase